MMNVKRSIKKQMILVFVGLTTFVIFNSILVNVLFLETYYLINKQDELVDMYEQLETAVGSGTLLEESTQELLQRTIEKGNIDLLLLNAEGNVVAYTNNVQEELQSQLIRYQLDRATPNVTLLEDTVNYQICQYRDPQSDVEYIEMWGMFENSESFILRSPVESIQESVDVSNRFLVNTGIVMIFISILLVYYFSNRITHPLLELAKLSTRMADLDFQAKYEYERNDEIGILGASFNAMSYKLEKTISELKTANNELQADIERKDKLEVMRTEFLGNVSHELKTPIALIQGYAEGLKDGISDDKESREFYCEVIMDEAHKMNNLVKNLLTLNQLEYGQQEMQLEQFDIIEMIQGVVQSLEIMMQQKEVKFLFDTKESIYAWGEHFQVEQVVRNYLTNALNHVCNENVIEVKVQTEGEKVRVSVFNTGNPIPEEDIERIWEKFYKVDKARTREYGGNGIGLSIVKAIMESLNQDYGARNYDNGVEFWFELDAK